MKKENKKNKNRNNGDVLEITDELKESYLDYAMSVIVSRALPDVRDGLKPVQRRILWSMREEGVTHSAKPRKSANIVGAVLGRYHPHGDMAVYDALARMAQDFSLRYPLIEGQGNWGSIDGDSPAAMRYTEARLSRIAEELLSDIEKETVDWQSNYDNSREEPKCLPAKLPHLMLNGTQGIAVGMATSIPPHNLQEIADAIIELSKNEEIGVKELMHFIKGPDFPTGGIIYDAGAIKEAYRTGRGPVTIRAKTEIEEGKRGAYRIVVTEIPYQVNKANLVAKIASLVQDKRISGIRDVRDESDREGLRMVIELKSDASPQKILNQLFLNTELQKNIHFNMLALLDGIQPQVFSLKEILTAYLRHREEVIKKKTEFDLKKAEERAHILEGLKKALDVIDKVIALIKKSKDRETAKQNLIKSFKLSELQANAILEMRLQTLAALERQKISNELAEKKKLIGELKLILKDKRKITGLIRTELEELKKNYPEQRRTALVKSSLKEFSEEDLIQKEETIIVFSKDGYIKRMPPSALRTQGRGGKGLKGTELREEDNIAELTYGGTHDDVLFFTNKGKVLKVKCYEIPVAARTAKGKSVHNFLKMPATENISAIVNYSSPSHFLVMLTKQGMIKKTPLKDFANIRSTGIAAVTLKKDDSLEWAALTSGSDEIIIATEAGRAIRFKEKDVRQMGRTAAGTRAMKLKKGDRIAGLGIIRTSDKQQAASSKLLVVTERGFAKQTPIKSYKVQRRGGGGILTAKISEKTGPVVSARVLDEDQKQIIVFSSKGVALRTELKNIRLAGRATQGVKIINLTKDDSLVGAICF